MHGVGEPRFGGAFCFSRARLSPREPQKILCPALPRHSERWSAAQDWKRSFIERSTSSSDFRMSLRLRALRSA